MGGLVNKKNVIKNNIFFRSSFAYYGKRGSGHLEMIIAFVFFTGFVFFLFTALKPNDVSTLPNAVITGLHDSFEERIYTNLSNVFLKIDYVGPQDCVSLRLPSIFDYEIVSDGSHVTKLGGDNINSDIKKSGNDWMLKINHEDKSSFRIAFSPEFSDGAIGGGCGNLNNDYEIGSVIERQVVSYSALERMVGEYYSNYSNLKNELKVPPIFDFAIVTEALPETNMEPKLGIPGSVDVMVESYVFGVLKSDGDFRNERFSFKIW